MKSVFVWVFSVMLSIFIICPNIALPASSKATKLPVNFSDKFNYFKVTINDIVYGNDLLNKKLTYKEQVSEANISGKKIYAINVTLKNVGYNMEHSIIYDDFFAEDINGQRVPGSYPFSNQLYSSIGKGKSCKGYVLFIVDNDFKLDKLVYNSTLYAISTNESIVATSPSLSKLGLFK